MNAPATVRQRPLGPSYNLLTYVQEEFVRKGTTLGKYCALQELHHATVVNALSKPSSDDRIVKLRLRVIDDMERLKFDGTYAADTSAKGGNPKTANRLVRPSPRSVEKAPPMTSMPAPSLPASPQVPQHQEYELLDGPEGMPRRPGEPFREWVKQQLRLRSLSFVQFIEKSQDMDVDYSTATKMLAGKVKGPKAMETCRKVIAALLASPLPAPDPQQPVTAEPPPEPTPILPEPIAAPVIAETPAAAPADEEVKMSTQIEHPPFGEKLLEWAKVQCRNRGSSLNAWSMQRGWNSGHLTLALRGKSTERLTGYRNELFLWIAATPEVAKPIDPPAEAKKPAAKKASTSAPKPQPAKPLVPEVVPAPPVAKPEPAPLPEHASAEETHIALLLVGGTEHITPEIVATWSEHQRDEAYLWAMASHFHASDNDDVTVPPCPPHVIQSATQQVVVTNTAPISQHLESALAASQGVADIVSGEVLRLAPLAEHAAKPEIPVVAQEEVIDVDDELMLMAKLDTLVATHIRAGKVAKTAAQRAIMWLGEKYLGDLVRGAA